MIGVTGLASYIIYREHNPQFRTKDQRRKFLKDPATQLCLPVIEILSQNRMMMRNHFLQSAVEMVLARSIFEAIQGEPNILVSILYSFRNISSVLKWRTFS